VTGWAEQALQQDAFLGGLVRIWQPKTGYRAGLDPVLLAASVEAVAGQSVLDLGCGAGTAALCLAARVPGLAVSGLELNAGYAGLAARNAAEAGVDLTLYQGDVADPPAALKEFQFHHVIANPPYYDRSAGSKAPDAVRELALGEVTPLRAWTMTAAKRLRPKGYAHVIVKADRLADILAGVAEALGSVEIIPLAPRADRPAERVIVRARKDGKAPLILHAPVVLHTGAAHPGDRPHFTPMVADVLRRGAPLRI